MKVFSLPTSTPHPIIYYFDSNIHYQILKHTQGGIQFWDLTEANESNERWCAIREDFKSQLCRFPSSAMPAEPELVGYNPSLRQKH